MLMVLARRAEEGECVLNGLLHPAVKRGYFAAHLPSQAANQPWLREGRGGGKTNPAPAGQPRPTCAADDRGRYAGRGHKGSLKKSERTDSVLLTVRSLCRDL